MKTYLSALRICAVVFALMASALTAAAQQLSILPAHVKCSYDIPEKAETQLRDKMLAALTATGLASMKEDAQVALWPSVTVVNEHTSVGVQTNVTMELNYTFTLVNLNTGVAYDSFVIRGVKTRGKNKVNAVALSFAKIELDTPEFLGFLNGAQNKMLAHYERTMAQTVAKAQTYTKNKEYADALDLLTGIPEETPSYTRVVLPAIENVYRAYVNDKAAKILADARAAWAASPNEEGAERVAELLSDMPIGSSSAAGAQQLMRQVQQRVKALDQRRWNAVRQQLARKHQEKMATIRAARAVAVAEARRPVRVNYIHVWRVY